MTDDIKRRLDCCDAVLFDLFGTLLIYGDMDAAWREWLERLHQGLCQHGLTASLDEFRESTKGFFHAPEPPEDEPGDTVFDRRLIAQLAELGMELTPSAAAAVRGPAIDAWMKYIELDPLAPQVLDDLRKSHKVALVSNFDATEPAERVVREMGLADCFDAVAISDAVGCKKPGPEIFYWTLQRLGVEPSQAIHVGDTEDDIDGARAADVLPVLIERIGPDDDPIDYHYDGEALRGSPADRCAGGPKGIVRIKCLTELRGLLRVK